MANTKRNRSRETFLSSPPRNTQLACQSAAPCRHQIGSPPQGCLSFCHGTRAIASHAIVCLRLWQRGLCIRALPSEDHSRCDPYRKEHHVEDLINW